MQFVQFLEVLNNLKNRENLSEYVSEPDFSGSGAASLDATNVFFISSETTADNSIFNSLIYKFFRELSVPRNAARVQNIFYVNISLVTIDIEELKLKLSSNFLGYKQIFFLNDFRQLKPEEKNKLIIFLKNYNSGTFQQNKIFIFDFQEETSDKSIAKSLIKLPAKIDLNIYKQLYNFFYNSNGHSNGQINRLIQNGRLTHSQGLLNDSLTESATQAQPELVMSVRAEPQFNAKFAFKLFQQNTIDLNLACTIMKYQFVLGRSWPDFFDGWFNKLSGFSSSLFDLSQAFFNKETKIFFSLWLKFKTQYPEEFWITYWSEQLWQASLFVLRAKRDGLFQAKKESYRLPFSFINKTWRNYSFESLSNAHNALYQFDHKFKNGYSGYNLELWYYKFLFDQLEN